MTGNRFVLGALAVAAALWLTAGAMLPSPNRHVFVDSRDFSTYFTMQGWIRPSRTLFERGYAEYPALALTYVNWPRLFVNGFTAYSWLLWISNLLLFILAGWFTWDVGQRLLAGSGNAWWLWLLPSALHYSLNRFDIFPVCLVLASLWLMLRGSSRSGWLCFGLAVALKLYPLFLLPLFLAVARSRDEVRWWQHLTYAAAGFLGPSLGGAVVGGWSAVASSYLLQARRALEWGSTLWLLKRMGLDLGTTPLTYALVKLVQFALPLWWFVRGLVRPKLNLRTHLTYAALTLLVMLTLNPFYSNHWWLWLLPFMVFTVPLRWVWLPVAYDVVNFLQYPLVYDLFTDGGWQFAAAVAVRSVFLILLAVPLMRQLPRGWWRLGASVIA